MEKIYQKYLAHKVFEQLNSYSNFYKDLSFHITGFITPGIQSIINIDTYVYSSIQGTLESIRDILLKGRINDSYSLLRKYYDSTIINIYSILYLSDNFGIDNFVVKQIDNWRKGTQKLPEYSVMSNYIRASEKLAPINNLLHQNDTYRKIKKRCNDHTHYNYYHYLILNDNEIFLQNRLDWLNTFLKDLEDIFIQHISYILYLNDHYMMSSDYVDSLDMGIIPDDDSKYFVASFIQEMFDSIFKVKRMDIALEIKKRTAMKLD